MHIFPFLKVQYVGNMTNLYSKATFIFLLFNCWKLPVIQVRVVYFISPQDKHKFNMIFQFFHKNLRIDQFTTDFRDFSQILILCKFSIRCTILLLGKFSWMYYYGCKNFIWVVTPSSFPWCSFFGMGF